MNLTALLFCASTLIATFAVTWMMFPMAAMSPEEAQAISTPVDAELMADIILPDFGAVPVFDMILHYIDNPPLESAPESEKVRFQGC